MAVFDSMEDRLMDQEEIEALELTKEELLERAERGVPAVVARKRPARVEMRGLDQGGVTVVGITIKKSEASIVRATEAGSLVVTGLRFGDEDIRIPETSEGIIVR